MDAADSVQRMVNETEGRPTITDVAREAGVARATAGRALGGYGTVQAKVRERILEAAHQLGYRPNHVARSMKTGRTDTIGVIGADIENPFFARVMRGIGNKAREAGLRAMLTNSDEDVDREREAIEALLAAQVDGLIVTPSDVRNVDHLTATALEETPLVLLDRPAEHITADLVTIDNLAASREATNVLLGAGHKRVAAVTTLRPQSSQQWQAILADPTSTPNPNLNTSVSRLVGYLQALQAASVPVDPSLICGVDIFTRQAVATAARDLLASPGRPTAIFATDNVITLGVIDAIRELKLEIPHDISLVGFDDLEWTQLYSPPITVVSQPIYQIGHEAATLLSERIAGRTGPPSTKLLPTQILERDSVAPPQT